MRGVAYWWDCGGRGFFSNTFPAHAMLSRCMVRGKGLLDTDLLSTLSANETIELLARLPGGALGDEGEFRARIRLM